MDELELVRLHEDGERLVLATRDGVQATLPITDALRAAIRGDRPRMESIRAHEESALRPREIQARLRAGETCEQLAEASGLPIDHVRRFEYPVISEREHAIARVRAKLVMTDDDAATTLGEIADERLRSRGVRPDDAEWTATREGTHPWVVQVEFIAAERVRSGRWTLEPRGGFVTALDDEARWLGLPEDDGGPALAGVSSLSTRTGQLRTVRPAPPSPDDTDLLLDNLSERRGQRPTRRQSPDVDMPDLLELDRELDAQDGPADDAHRTEQAGPDDEPGAHGAPGAHDVPEEPATPAASVVDLGARRSRPRTGAIPVPTSPADLEWEAPSRWEIPGPGAPVRDQHARDQHEPADEGHAEPGPGQGAQHPAGHAAGHAPGHGAGHAPAHGTGRPPGPEQPQEPVPEPEQAPAEAKRPAAKRGRKSRAQVPSWDEIVFGSRPEV